MNWPKWLIYYCLHIPVYNSNCRCVDFINKVKESFPRTYLGHLSVKYIFLHFQSDDNFTETSSKFMNYVKVEWLRQYQQTVLLRKYWDIYGKKAFFKYQEVWKWFLGICGILFIFKEINIQGRHIPKPILILYFLSYWH